MTTSTKAPVNYTPHTVTVRPADGSPDIVYPPSGVVARVSMSTAPRPPLPDGSPTVAVGYGGAILPEGDGPAIVSTRFADTYMRRQSAHNRSRLLFVPDFGPSAIRENGQIVAVRALIRR